jgi:diguanylate cyclase (GGDEF)-like protein
MDSKGTRLNLFAKSKDPLSARRLTSYYLTALMIIAGLTIASHLILGHVLRHNQGNAAVINISGRQRMLCQRIASLAAQYRLGDATARPPLIDAINEFATTQAALSAANRAIANPDAETLEIRGIYAAGPQSLDAAASRFVADARLVAGLAPANPAAAAPLARIFAAARAPMLAELNQVVAIHQSETERILAELACLQRAIIAIVLITLGIEAQIIFRPMIRQIVEYTGEITRLATIDPLTELPNRRGFFDRAEAETTRAQRYNHPLSLLMLDADHFKQINDSYGHEAGDQVLRALAGALREILRGGDIAGRLGGEEFAILTPQTDLPGAAQLARRLQAKIAGLAVSFGTHTINITVSIGVAPVPPAPDGLARALRDADSLLYRAKNTGRNRVVTAGPG